MGAYTAFRAPSTAAADAPQRYMRNPSRRTRHAAAGCRSTATDRPDPIVSTDWLQRHLHDVTVLDVRGHVDTALTAPGVEVSRYVADYNAYLAGHIAGAVFHDWTRDGIDAADAAPVQLQMDPDAFAAAMEAKGVSHERNVVVYDAGDGMFAARLWWMLTVHGHPSPRILEGGYARWQAEQRATQMHEPCTLKVHSYFEPHTSAVHRVTADDIVQLLRDDGAAGEYLLVDTRSEEQYEGQVRRGPRAGRIPGALKLPRRQLLDSQGGWLRTLDEQRDAILAAGIALARPEQRVVAYCNGGVAACTLALALHRLGHDNWAVYDGSWNEWSADDQLPVQSS